MRAVRESEISVASSDGATAYERARQVLRLGVLANDDSPSAAKVITVLPAKPVRDPTAVSDQAVTGDGMGVRDLF